MRRRYRYDRAAAVAPAIEQIVGIALAVEQQQALENCLRDEFEDERRQAVADTEAAIDRESMTEAEEVISTEPVITKPEVFIIEPVVTKPVLTKTEVIITEPAMTEPEVIITESDVMMEGEPIIDA